MRKSQRYANPTQICVRKSLKLKPRKRLILWFFKFNKQLQTWNGLEIYGLRNLLECCVIIIKKGYF
jgi:hypothetical protein